MESIRLALLALEILGPANADRHARSPDSCDGGIKSHLQLLGW